jgi:RHS repeat-associated protein
VCKVGGIGDDSGRIAMLEKRTIGNAADDNNTQASLRRFVYSNHLQSSSLELDDKAAVISYEEYHAYGTTSYQSRNTNINALAKRYRFTGKERDEESGLNYHGARYYMPWLGRWCAVDDLEAKYAGLNGYAYCANNPLLYIDIDGKDIIVFTTVLVQIPTVTIDQKTGQQTQAYNTITQCYTTAIIAEGPNEYFERTIIAYVDNTMKVLPPESEKQDVTKTVSRYDHVKAGKLITQFGLPSWYTDRSFISTPNSSASLAAENELSGLKQTQRDVEFYQQDKESKETQLGVVKFVGALVVSELALSIFGLSAMFGLHRTLRTHVKHSKIRVVVFLPIDLAFELPKISYFGIDLA